jgi:hypothetical protein
VVPFFSSISFIKKLRPNTHAKIRTKSDGILVDYTPNGGGRKEEVEGQVGRQLQKAAATRDGGIVGRTGRRRVRSLANSP